jgi:restriction system protein
VWTKSIYHPGLKAHRLLRGPTEEIVELKARLQCEAWDQRWAKIEQAQARRDEKEHTLLRLSQKAELALQRTRDVEAELTSLQRILRDGIEVDHVLEWDALKDQSLFTTPRPAMLEPQSVPRPPDMTDAQFQPRLSFLDRLLPSRHELRKAEAKDRFRSARNQWVVGKELAEKANSESVARHKAEVEAWEEQKRLHAEGKAKQHAAIEQLHAAYEHKELDGLREYWDQVLSRSEYPDSFPRGFTFDYISEAKLLVVEYSLPDVSCFPKLKEVKYTKSRDEFKEMQLSEKTLREIYNDVLYQITLRSVLELFQSDAVDAINTIVFNGWVNSVDKAVGKEVNACILSLQVTKTEFMELNLANVQPKACFKKLKGVSGSDLLGLSAVRPILQLNKEDKRFVPSYGVIGELDDSVNLAGMDWLDFENLIRELFEKEFTSNGGEVKITRASRDGGVDAIAFDPDPIRGGKIVIQAKRYTNPVGVSAVRDLFGTVHNEGATKGILVTTSDYGPDAYEFAKGKPLTLLSGSELLYLLHKHGHRARINLAEAKKILAAEEQAAGKADND